MVVWKEHCSHRRTPAGAAGKGVGELTIVDNVLGEGTNGGDADTEVREPVEERGSHREEDWVLQLWSEFEVKHPNIYSSVIKRI